MFYLEPISIKKTTKLICIFLYNDPDYNFVHSMFKCENVVKMYLYLRLILDRHYYRTYFSYTKLSSMNVK